MTVKIQIPRLMRLIRMTAVKMKQKYMTDIMLTPPDFVDDRKRQVIYNFAPAEGNRPLSIFRDQYSGEMAYSGIFLGQKDQMKSKA